MPALDGTGPMGLGPRTGGGRGWCNPYYTGTRSWTGGFPLFQPSGWGMPHGFGMYPWNPYVPGFRGFPYRPYGFRRAMRRRWW
jgi:hypothetical protein